MNMQQKHQNIAIRIHSIAGITLALYSFCVVADTVQIPNVTTGNTPEAFIGNAAKPKKIPSSAIPQNPYMQSGSFSALHNETVTTQAAA